ncbi:hypothetical protein D3C81_1256540 [compost metagenome]
MEPEKMYLPFSSLLFINENSWSSSDASSSAFALRSASVNEPLPELTASSLTRCRMVPMEFRVLSAVPRALRTLTMLPLYCFSMFCCCSSCSRRAAPTGSSLAERTRMPSLASCWLFTVLAKLLW